VVAEALRFAARATDSMNIRDYFDERQRYLQLRQRGRSVSWFVRAKGGSKKIGSAIPDCGDPEYLTLNEARRRAGEAYFGKPSPQVPPASGWTWAELDRHYQTLLTQRRRTGHRIKHPSNGTQSDVRLCFSKPEFAGWQRLSIADLTPLHLTDLINKVHKARGHRSCEKTLAYVKAALSWAQSENALESGLGGTFPWWAKQKPPQPTEAELDAMEARAAALEADKTGCLITHLGELLVRHEQFCAERSGNEKISPGLRWGVWWLVLTANRSFTSTKLRRDAIQWNDPYNPYSTADQPWGVVQWPPEHMKNKRRFMLPIPSIGLHILRCCMWDWELSVNRRLDHREITEWVFASTRRGHRITHPNNPDPSVYPNSFAAHFRALRGCKGANAVDYLSELPKLWPHLIRAVTSNFFASHRLTVPPAASSAMIGHVLPLDNELDHRQMSTTTKEYYLTAQYMDLKTIAIKVWSEALMEAYVKVGGQLPMPREKSPFKPEGPDWIIPQFPHCDEPATDSKLVEHRSRVIRSG
jgi:hypothetical protein